MTQLISAAMVAADLATQAELDAVSGVASGAAAAAAAAALKSTGDVVQGSATGKTPGAALENTAISGFCWLRREAGIQMRRWITGVDIADGFSVGSETAAAQPAGSSR